MIEVAQNKGYWVTPVGAGSTGMGGRVNRLGGMNPRTRNRWSEKYSHGIETKSWEVVLGPK
jgi:hypothetical protein